MTWFDVLVALKVSIYKARKLTRISKSLTVIINTRVDGRVISIKMTLSIDVCSVPDHMIRLAANRMYKKSGTDKIRRIV